MVNTANARGVIQSMLACADRCLNYCLRSAGSIYRIKVDAGVSRKAGKAIDTIPLWGDPEGAQISVSEHKDVQSQTGGDVERSPIAREGVIERDDCVDLAG
jgi:hypothetical protein